MYTGFIDLFRKRKESLVELSQGQKVLISFEGEQINRQVALIGLTEEDLRVVKQLKQLVEPHLTEIVDGFYAKVLDIPVLRKIIYDHSSPEKLKGTLTKHLAEMLDGNFDETYLQQRMTIARVHTKINLDPNWYMGAFQLLQHAIINLINEKIECKEDAYRFIGAITRMFNFEQQLVLDEYNKSTKREILDENAKVRNEVKDRIGVTSESLAAISEETQTFMEELMASSTEVSITVHKTAEQSAKTQGLAKEGYTHMVLLDEKINEIQSSSDEMDLMIGQLNSSSKEIQEVVNFVKNIAEQTNLLSLNSSIEAARAGEFGKGFAVVAEEIRKLSDETKNSVTKITGLINRNNELISKSMESLTEMKGKIEEGSRNSDGTKTSFGGIVSSMDESIGYVDQAVTEIHGLITGIHRMGAATENIANSAEELNETTRDF